MIRSDRADRVYQCLTIMPLFFRISLVLIVPIALCKLQAETQKLTP